MTRVFKNPPSFVVQDTVADASKAVPYRNELDHFDTPRELRLGSVYKPGEIVYARDGDKILLCRIVYVISHFLSIRDYYIPCYRCQFATKSGSWSRQWRDIFPGYIERAYLDDETNKPVDVAELYRQQAA